MRYFAAIAAAVLVAALAVPVALAPEPVPAINPRDTVHIVTIHSPTGEIIGNGSGVMVAPMLMLTAAHMVGHGPIFVGSKAAPAKVLHIDRETDIALLQVAMFCPCAPLAESAPPIDAPVLAIGYPSFPNVGQQIATEGRTQGVFGNRLIFTAPIAPGNSGGGLFVKGKLVGIVVELVGASYGGFMMLPVNHLGRAVDTATMLRFVGNRLT